MKSILKNLKYRRIFWILVIVILLVVSYLLFHGMNYFTHKGISEIRRQIRSFGILSPIVVIFLIIISTAVPPLPLPVPLIELAAGVAFGFIEGALVVWISQIGASIAAFYLTKFFKKRFFAISIIKNNKWDFYREYLNKKGAFAIFLIRFVMAAPFNIISFLAGLTQITFFDFFIATAFGTIPESLLYTFLGSQIRTLHIRIAYLSLLIILIGSVGFVFTLILMFLLRPQRLKK